MASSLISPLYVIPEPRNCFRCGQDFASLPTENGGVQRTCPACRAPQRRTRARYSEAITIRDRQIIALVRQARLNKEIAYELHLSEGTIKEFLCRIFRKVGVRSRVELAVWAVQNADQLAA